MQYDTNAPPGLGGKPFVGGYSGDGPTSVPSAHGSNGERSSNETPELRLDPIDGTVSFGTMCLRIMGRSPEAKLDS